MDLHPHFSAKRRGATFSPVGEIKWNLCRLMVYPKLKWLESYRVDSLHYGKMVSRRHIVRLQDSRFLEPVFLVFHKHRRFPAGCIRQQDGTACQQENYLVDSEKGHNCSAGLDGLSGFDLAKTQERQDSVCRVRRQV